MTKINLICGDSLVEIKKIADKSVDLIVTDPPYNLAKDYEITKDNLPFNEYIDWTKEWLIECQRVLKDDGTIYVFMGVRFISYIYTIMERELGMEFNSWITWRYTQGVGKRKGFSNRHEDILMFTKTKKFNFYLDDVRVPQKLYRSVNNMRGSNPSDVWEFSHIHYNQDTRSTHPTQKPEGIYERIIKASSKEGDVVLDLFCGSGTSLRVCQQLNRNGIGIEINPNYVEKISERLQRPFNGFDSYDKSIQNVPKDLNNKEYLLQYISNHVEWFIGDNLNAKNQFYLDIKAKYGDKLDEEDLKTIHSIIYN